MKNFIFILQILLSSTLVYGQFEVDKDLILNGILGSDRQVEGLGDPVNEDALINAENIQFSKVNYAITTGVDDLEVDIEPFPTSIISGTSLFLFISTTNTNSVSLTINGIGPYSIKKNVNEDLAPADLQAGEVVRVIFDGTNYQIVNSRTVEKRECPVGFVAVNDQFCIQANEQDTLHFFDAAIICGDLGGRLCTWGEWHAACQDTSLQLNDMVGDWEWTNSTANGDQLVRVVGAWSCYSAVTSPSQNILARSFHCCYAR